MRNMLAFLAAMTLAFVCTGWYLDWFSFRSAPAPAGHQSITIDINTPKIAAAVLTVEQKIQQKIAEKAKEAPPTPVAQPAPKPALQFPVIDLSADN